MAKILLLGTWLTNTERARQSIAGRTKDVQFGGLAGQLEVRGPRIEIERALVVNDRTWQHGMPRSVVEGQVEQLSDALFVVVDEERPRRS